MQYKDIDELKDTLESMDLSLINVSDYIRALELQVKLS